MYTLSFEIQPKDSGDMVSWRWFLLHKLVAPNAVERKMGLTVGLTDAISTMLKAAQSVDPGCQVSLERFSGFLFPDLIITIVSEKFSIEAEKIFSGGASRENVFNYRVRLTLRSESEGVLKLLRHLYGQSGPQPLTECFENACA